MSFRGHEQFLGLYEANQIVGTPRRGFESAVFSQIEHAGFFTCTYPSGFFPFLDIVSTCRQTGPLSVVTDFDVMATAFETDPGLTLAEFAALDPPPDFAQVFVVVEATAVGGNPSGACPTAPGCLPNSTAQATFRLSADCGAYFPFSVTETIAGESGPVTYTDEIVDYDGSFLVGSGDAGAGRAAGYLRRTPDGDSYTGHPLNEGTDTLIPWSDLVANPTVYVGMDGGTPDLGSSLNLHSVEVEIAEVTVYPWYIYGGAPAPNVMCVL